MRNDICPRCDKGHNELRGMSMPVKGVAYCLKHGKQESDKLRQAKAKRG